jgi:hypothetical protein
VLLDVVLPVAAVAICGYTIYSSIVPVPPAPISYSVWIALGWLALGVIIVGIVLVTHPEAVRGFGRAFVGTSPDDGADGSDGADAHAAAKPEEGGRTLAKAAFKDAERFPHP